jgi:hypothetical protein
LTCARDTDRLNGTYNDLDLTPLGRQEGWEEPSGRGNTSALGVGPPPRHVLRQERWPGVVIQSIGIPSFEESRKETPDMRYMLLIYMDEERWEKMSAQEKGVIFQEAVEFSQGLRKSGVYQGGDPLHPTSTATTVRMKHGKTVMTDGPFAETKEQLGGYSIVEAKDLDEALAVAARHPLLRVGLSIEVRPIREGPPQ